MAGQPQQQTLNKFQFDAILVLAHADADDGAVDLLHAALRGYVGPDMAVAYAAGRTHRRAHRKLDGRAAALQARRFLETIGYLSFHPGTGPVDASLLDADRASLLRALGVADDGGPEDGDDGGPGWTTENGKELSAYIRRTMEHAGANEVLGCANGRYRADGAPDDADSLSRLWRDRRRRTCGSPKGAASTTAAAPRSRARRSRRTRSGSATSSCNGRTWTSTPSGTTCSRVP